MKCGACKYYESFCDDETRIHRMKTKPAKECHTCSVDSAKCDDGTSGFCHRYPPTLDDGKYHISVWNDNWCGEFKPKEVEVDLTVLIPKRFKEHAEEIIKVVKLHKNNPRQIVMGLRKLGVIAKSTYWADVRFYKPIIKILNEREDQNDTDTRNPETHRRPGS